MKNKIVRPILVGILIIAAACISVYVNMRNDQKPVEQVVTESILKEPDAQSPKFSVYTKDCVALDVTLLYANYSLSGFSVYCPMTQKYIQIKNTDKICVSAYNQDNYFLALHNALRMYFIQYDLEELTQTKCPVTNII